MEYCSRSGSPLQPTNLTGKNTLKCTLNLAAYNTVDED
jgi:hypothetical protein